MKRKKLTLEELQVQSFVTKLDSQLAHTAKGGDDDGTSGGTWCVGVTFSLGSGKVTGVSGGGGGITFSIKITNKSTATIKLPGTVKL